MHSHHGGHHVDPHNRIAVGGSGESIVHYRFTPEVVHALVRGTITSARIFFAAGARRVHIPWADEPIVDASQRESLDELDDDRLFVAGKVSVSAAHLQGGCGMGRSAADSVTNSYGQVHDVPWLYVADASLFPDSVEINPYLTIMALADRVAEHIREEAWPREGRAR